MAFMIFVSVIFFFWHDPIALFTDDQAVIAIGGDWLQILSYSYFVWLVDGVDAGIQRRG